MHTLDSAWKHDSEKVGTRSDLLHQVGETISIACESFGLVGQKITVLQVCLAAGRIRVDIAHETGGNPRAIVQELAETPGALDLYAAQVGSGIDHLAILRSAQLAQSIKMLQSKAHRIVVNMADRAAGVRHMREQTVANSPLVAGLHLGKIGIRRRIRGRQAVEDFIQLYAAPGGGGRSRVGEERQESHFGKNAGPL